MSKNISLLVKKLDTNAYLPARGSNGAAGYDICSNVDIIVPSKGKNIISTGLSIAIPEGTYARLAPRSGLAWKNFIDVAAGVIDFDFRGEIKVILFNHGDTDFDVKKGDKICQLILEKIEIADIKEVDSLDLTERGSNGFGSTGLNINKK